MPDGLFMRVVPLKRNEVGFDYAQALRELHACMTYAEIAEYCGYKTTTSVFRVITGKTIPSHPFGEAIYILYVEKLGKKPPQKIYSSISPMTL